MNAEERKKVLRPEKVVDDIIDSAAEIRVLGQLLHDKTDDLQEKMDKQAKELKDETAGLREKMDTQAKELKEENKGLHAELKEENVELRKLLETQMQSTTELKDMLIKMMAASQDK